MKMLFIYPGFGKKKGQKYIFQLRTFEPLTFAYLRALTPYDIECELIDERVEAIDYNNDADVVVLSEKQLKNKNIKFFLGKNPNYQKGDELVCLAEISFDNLTNLGKRVLKEISLL